MATRAATFTAKIRNLKDYHSRIINSVYPLPNGSDIANNLKYFSQTLIGVLKDVPLGTKFLFVRRKTNRECLQVFPDLDYMHLYETVESIIDIVPSIVTGQHALGESLLGVLGCLAPFLSSSILDTLPYLVASTLTIFPSSLHRDILMLLCSNLLPITINQLGNDSLNSTYATDSVPSILMITFQFAHSKEYHSMIVECLMTLKKDVYKDLLYVIAYGTSQSRGTACHLLFYYWPQLNPMNFDQRGIYGTYSGFEFVARSTILCQRSKCLNNRCVAAVKSSLDPRLVTDTLSLPMHLCQSCVDELDAHIVQQLDIVVRRIERMELHCENEECPNRISGKNIAVCTCFSPLCICFNDQRPVRLCNICHIDRHDENSNHIFHLTLPNLGYAHKQLQLLMVDAIITLLKEAESPNDKRMLEMDDERGRLHCATDNDEMNTVMQNGRLLSRYGLWLLAQLVPPDRHVPFEMLGRLLSGLFHWFDITTYLKDDMVGNALNRLKSNCVSQWLANICVAHVELIAACLLPHPLEFFKVAACYDATSSPTLRLKEGLNRLLCLVPYNVISIEVWDYVIPYWLEAIRTEIDNEQLLEFKILFRKLFDVNIRATTFNIADMFLFAKKRFKCDSSNVHHQTLLWLQMLTVLKVYIDVNILIDMFSKSVKLLLFDFNNKNITKCDFVEKTEIERKHLYKICVVLMLEIILNQLDIQKLEPHKNVKNKLNQCLLNLLCKMNYLILDGHSESSLILLKYIKLSYGIVKFIVAEEKLPLKKEDCPFIIDKFDQNKIQNVDGNLKDLNFNFIAPQFQLLNSYVKVLKSQIDCDVKVVCLSIIDILCQHSNFIEHYDNSYEKYFVECFVKSSIMHILWGLMKSGSNNLNGLITSLLTFLLTTNYGPKVFWTIIEHDFSHEIWSVRFAAVEKICVLASLLTHCSIESNQQVIICYAHAFCHMIACLDDLNSAIAIKTILLLETLNNQSLQCICFCLERHFDLVIRDRTLILDMLYKLSSALTSIKKNHFILTWEFFFDRLDVLCIEGQINLEAMGELNHIQDLHHSDLLSEYFLDKVARARYAMSNVNVLSTLNECLFAKLDNKFSHQAFQLFSKQSASLTNKESKRLSRQQPTIPYRNKGSRFGLTIFSNFPACGHLREFTDGESGFANMLQKAIDSENVDQSTLHHLISLLMKFMANAANIENMESTKSQGNVLWHLNILLGYNQSEKTFTIPPYKLRGSVVFNAYISSLAKVLDRNFDIGNMMLPLSLDILQYVPSPQRYASDYQPPNYSLWFLEPHTRLSWLQIVLIILYKYSYSHSDVVIRLIKIIINTIDARFHQCKNKEENIVPPSPFLQRNRDTSNVSVGDLENILETETPPTSPGDDTSVLQNEVNDMLNNVIGDVNSEITNYIPSPMSSKPTSPILSKFSSANNTFKILPQGLKSSQKLKEKVKSEDDQARRIAEYNQNSVFATDEHSSPSSFSSLMSKSDSKILKEMDNKFCGNKKEDGMTDDDAFYVDEFYRFDKVKEIEDDSVSDKSSIKPNFRSRKMRKSGLSMVQLVKDLPEFNHLIISDNSIRSKSRRSDLFSKHIDDHDVKHKISSSSSSIPAMMLVGSTSSKSVDNLLVDHCTMCSSLLESYDEETINMAIVCLATFIHREPTMAAPLLPSMLMCVSRIAARSPFLWQAEQINVVLPGNSMNTACQFIRCVLHQLAPNNVFPQLFISNIWETTFLKILATSLSDFPELNCTIALQLTLEGINDTKALNIDQVANAIINFSNFMDHLSMDTSSSLWSNIINLFDTFFRKVINILSPLFTHINSLLNIMISILKNPSVSSNKSILEPFSKVMSFAIQFCNFQLQLLIDVCSLCGRAFNKDRDKFYLSRCVVFELVQTIKFKQTLPDENFVLLVQMACLDAGGTLGPVNIVKELSAYKFNPHSQSLVSTNIAECMKNHLSDCIDFIADIHTTNKLKSNIKGASQNLNEDTLGSHLKIGISQFIALEFSQSSSKDTKLVSRYLPWLFHPPSAMQQGPREFVDCICHIRILCWLLLGSLMHSSVTKGAGSVVCRPLSLDTSIHIADHIMVILTGFTGQAKTSVLHMSSLFHAFMLCQLWTIYCELQNILDMPCAEDLSVTSPQQTIMDFWAKVTPGILQLLSHSKIMAEMVNLHLLSLMEALQECNSTVLVKLFSLWVPILRSYHSQLPGHMQVRLQMCQNWRPSISSSGQQVVCDMLFKWIKRAQFKLGQIEVQSSTATQFYAV